MAVQDVIDRLRTKVYETDQARVAGLLRDAQNTLCNQYGLQLGRQMSGMYDGAGKQMTVNEVFVQLGAIIPGMRLDAAVLAQLSIMVNNA